MSSILAVPTFTSPRDWRARFWSKVAKSEGCWYWQAWRDRYGYGGVRINKRLVGAHIVSYELCVGSVPSGLELDHKCRNRGCVRPDHLEPVTKKVNTLRGVSPSAVNARKTQCDSGHELVGDNLIFTAGRSGQERRCRACRVVAQLRHKQSFKVERRPNPTPEELAALVNVMSYSDIARRFGVSDTAVRKWTKKFGLVALGRNSRNSQRGG